MISIDAFIDKQVVTAAGSDTVAQAAASMKDSSIGAVVLVDDGKPTGIFSERDLLTRVVAEGRDPATTKLDDVATKDIVTVKSGSSIRECAEALRAHGVRHLPVVDDGQITGIVSARDFFVAVAGELERYIERIRYDEQLRENTDPYDHLGGSYGR